MSAPKLTPAQIDQLIEWREAGRSHAWIAQRLGVTDGAVNYQCLKNGVLAPHQKPARPYHGPLVVTGKDGRTQRRFSEEEDATLVRLAAEGKTIRQIATIMSRPRTSVRMRMLMKGQQEELAA